MRRTWVVFAIIALTVFALLGVAPPTPAAAAEVGGSTLGEDRLFVRTNSDRSQIEIGGGAAGPATRAIRFTVAQPEIERWPESLSITIKEANGSVWTTALEPRVALKPHVLHAPRGSYELTFTAAHHRPLQRNVTLSDTDADLGTLHLVRYPVITGRVRAGNGSPVAGAFVSDRAELSAKTDTLGAYSLEITKEWPSRIEISYPGLTTKEIAVPKAQASTKLADVTLFKGSQLVIEIDGLTEDADVDLATEGDGRRVNIVNVLRTVHVKQDAPQAVFEDLDHRAYVAIIRGVDALKRLAIPMDVGEAAVVAKNVRIEPIDVEIDVQRGDSPAANAFVTVQGEGNRWAADLRTGSDGRVSAQAWQRGEFVFAVRLTEASAPILLLHAIAGATKATVHIEIPNGTVAGRVLDAETGSPIVNAKVYALSENDDGTGGAVSTNASADGKFLFEGLRDGAHTLKVEADGYLHSEPSTIRVDQTLPRRDVSLRVSRGVSRQLHIVTPGGLPIRNAVVVPTVSGSVTGVLNTDAMGQVTLRLPPDSATVIYVMPAEGSFAITRLSSSKGEGVDTIVVPAGSATLELRAQDTNGQGIANVRFVMRYNGELFPPEVAQILVARRGIAAMTGADGVARIDRLPPGFLELWPARGGQEASDIIAAGASAPIQIALKDGLNVASMTFKRKQ